MKKLITFSTAATGFLMLAKNVFAAIPVGSINPSGGVSPSTSIGTVIGNIITIVIVIAALAVLFMLIFGAFEWITSGGDKDAVAKARNRILHALIGLVILAVAILIIKVAGAIVGIDFQNLSLPSLGDNR